jgi:5-guanidino-2-oxopentanoate decarboxylase
MNATTLRCGEALMALLRDYGVDTVFGMPGTHTVELYRGIARSSLRHVQCRNEQGASLMADGYFRATGKPGVCVIVTGPGVTNAATGIAQAYSDSHPMLVISGAGAVASQGKGWGTVHELDDQSALTRGITGLSAMVHDPTELPELVARAFALFRAGRPRPAHLSLPWDLIGNQVAAPWAARHIPCRPHAYPALATQAAELLRSARTPMLVLGGGAAEAGDNALAIARQLGAPVLSSNAGKGIVPEDDPLSLGCSMLCRASQKALADADVVLIVGCQIAEGDHFLPHLPINGKIIRIDLDPAVLVAQYPATLSIQGDAAPCLALVATELARMGPRDGEDGQERTAAIVQANEAAMSPVERRHAAVWSLVRKALPEDAIVMGDATQLVYTGSYAFRVRQPRCWHYPGTYCGLGVALPMAIGAKIGAPLRAVMAVAGDGGLMFTINELATAAEEGLALPVLVWNNHALKEIVDQMDQRGIARTGVEPISPDFAQLAAGLRCNSARPDTAHALVHAITQALQADRPTLIQVDESTPWEASA